MVFAIALRLVHCWRVAIGDWGAGGGRERRWGRRGGDGGGALVCLQQLLEGLLIMGEGEGVAVVLLWHLLRQRLHLHHSLPPLAARPSPCLLDC